MSPRSFFRRTRSFWAGILIAALAGCTNIHNDSDRTRTEGVLAGAAGGAAVGAGAAALLKKGKPGDIAAGAAAGALVGGVAGAAYGNSVAKKKEGYAAQEDALDLQLASLKREIAGDREYNGALKRVVASKEQQLTAILASDRAQGLTVQEFDLRTTIVSKLSEIDHQSRSWQETIDAHKAVLKKSAADPHSGELQTAIDQLSAQRAELLRQRASLAAIPDKLER